MKKLHLNKKIFFENPRVLQVQFDGRMNYDNVKIEYRKLCFQTHKKMIGTWGYSDLRIEHLGKAPETVTVQGFNGTSTPGYVFYDVDVFYRGYVCFKEETDLLFFKLYSTAPTKLVKIWPETFFTIHEVI